MIDWNAVEEKARARCPKDQKTGLPVESLIDNYRFHTLYASDAGVIAATAKGPERMSRRRWIERFVKVKNKAGKLVPFILNEAQRRMEAQVLRMERRGTPVRIIILKARQQGFSTFVVALFLWHVLTHEYARALIIAHKRDASKAIFERAKLMYQLLEKAPGVPWEIQAKHSSRAELVFDEPLHGQIVIDSAEVEAAGRSETVQLLHISEAPSWPDAGSKAQALLPILPKMPGTYGFNESTGKGDVGWFPDEFKAAWERVYGLSSGGLVDPGGWWPMFFPWYGHQEYRWSRINNKPVPEALREEIERTLDNDERELLNQSYIIRGVGRRSVDYDQLAWRRYTIVHECARDLQKFHAEYPATWEEALYASGSPIFDHALLRAQTRLNVQPPEWVGEILDPDGEPRLMAPIPMPERVA